MATPVAAGAAVIEPTSSTSRQRLLICIGLAVIVLLVFGQVRNHQFVNFDDPIYVDNEHVKKGITLDGIGWAMTSFDFNWHPLTWISHMLDAELFGRNPGAHLLVNVGFHAANSVLVFLVLSALTGALWRSAVVAAIFAIHPLHVESVAWLSERKDVLCATFFLLALLAYARFVRTRAVSSYVLMCVAFSLALMAKGMAVTLPFVLLLLDWWPLQRIASLRPADLWPPIREKIPLFIITLLGSLITYQSQRALSSLASTVLLPLPVRIGNTFFAYGRYLLKSFWPSDLAIPYAFRSVPFQSALLSAAVIIGISVFVVVYRERRYLAAGWFWFVGMIVPVSGLVQIGAYSMADRYSYLPMIGLSFAVVWVVADLVSPENTTRLATAVVTSIVLVLFSVSAYSQTSYWRDSISLFSHTLNVEPNNPFASLLLGNALLDAGQAADAERAFRASAQMWPSAAPPRYGLGMALAAQGRSEEAADELRRSLEIDPKNDAARFELGRLELISGRSDKAAEILGKSGASSPISLGTLALARNDLNEALKQFKAAVAADPKSSEARNNLGATLAKMGRDNEAVAEYEEALRITPDQYDGRMNLGALLSRMGRNADAASNFEAAAKIRPNSTEPLVYRALALAISGYNKDAALAARQAYAIDKKTANQQFTNATRAPFKETNFEEFIGSLEAQQPQK